MCEHVFPSWCQPLSSQAETGVTLIPIDVWVKVRMSSQLLYHQWVLRLWNSMLKKQTSCSWGIWALLTNSLLQGSSVSLIAVVRKCDTLLPLFRLKIWLALPLTCTLNELSWTHHDAFVKNNNIASYRSYTSWFCQRFSYLTNIII